ncbi:MAG: hypothetical protein R3308_11500, partial [Thiohalobacterales bacterium]|nr:hypothetical protein [Thiohalobacterales bacterium]
LLVTEEDCTPESLDLPGPPVAVLGALATNLRSPLPVGGPAHDFAEGAVRDINSPGGFVPVTAFPQFQDDLEQERQEIEDDLEDYSLWPVLAFSIGFRF